MLLKEEKNLDRQKIHSAKKRKKEKKKRERKMQIESSSTLP